MPGKSLYIGVTELDTQEGKGVTYELLSMSMFMSIVIATPGFVVDDKIN